MIPLNRMGFSKIKPVWAGWTEMFTIPLEKSKRFDISWSVVAQAATWVMSIRVRARWKAPTRALSCKFSGVPEVNRYSMSAIFTRSSDSTSDGKFTATISVWFSELSLLFLYK